jgi:solute:Na+ symporter, SSS family
MENLNWQAAGVFIFFFLLVTIIGFAASRWRAADLNSIGEWGLGGRSFGPVISWFLIGGDLYTAYTVIAIPAVVYAIGAYGFFAVPLAAFCYPLLYMAFPRMWNVCAKHGYVTASDFVLGRFGNRWLELAIAVTGILATMPYIALQLVGMEKVIEALGFKGDGFVGHVPLTLAFIILALYTYKAGIRAPAMIAFVKDIMIYVFVIAAVVVIPYKLGGFGAMFDAADQAFTGKTGAGLTLQPGQMGPFLTLTIGTSLSLFLYPHMMTGVLSSSGPSSIRKNAYALPAYAILLGLIALMGIMAHAAGIKVANPQDAIPQLFLKMFPAWFAGFTFAAIAIAALVPAAIMSIGASNTFTRNIWKAFVNPNMTPREEAFIAKILSMVVKFGALLVILFMPTKFALDLQLLGGIWMLQAVPAIFFGLWTRWYSGSALLIGWAAGMIVGTALAWGPDKWNTVHAVFDFGFSSYIGLSALVVNVIVSTVLSMILTNAAKDETLESDYADTDVPIASAAAH